MDYNKQVTVSDFRQMILKAVRFIKANLVVLVVGFIVFACIGVIYAWSTAPSYTAEVTYAAENDKDGFSAYSGIAAQFGLDLGQSGGSVFEGENLTQLFKSRMLVEKALLTEVKLNGETKPLVYRYLSVNKMDENLGKGDLKDVSFSAAQSTGNRARDSILNNIVRDVTIKLSVDKVDKRSNITSVRYTDTDEMFAKVFVETLVENAISFYTEYRSKKARQNVQILQRQADSVYALVTGGITNVAATSDLNVNPLRQITRAPLQRKQVDIQVNSRVYEEILKQLELAKIAMRRETPLIQVIDTPRYPLPKKKMGRFKGGIIFGIVGLFLTFITVVIRRFLKG